MMMMRKRGIVRFERQAPLALLHAIPLANMCRQVVKVGDDTGPPTPNQSMHARVVCGSPLVLYN
jgi:hypothetical protein